MDRQKHLSKQSFKTISDKVEKKYANFILENIDDNYCLRIAVMQGDYKWHYHKSMDELFIVLEGELKIEIKGDENIFLKQGDYLKIPAMTIHKTSAVVRTVNLCFEKDIDDTVFME